MVTRNNTVTQIDCNSENIRKRDIKEHLSSKVFRNSDKKQNKTKQKRNKTKTKNRKIRHKGRELDQTQNFFFRNSNHQNLKNNLEFQVPLCGGCTILLLFRGQYIFCCFLVLIYFVFSLISKFVLSA